MKVTYVDNQYHIYLNDHSTDPDDELHIFTSNPTMLAFYFASHYSRRPDYYYLKQHFKESLLTCIAQQLEENL